jgi:hypothetical protein
MLCGRREYISLWRWNRARIPLSNEPGSFFGVSITNESLQLKDNNMDVLVLHVLESYFVDRM